MEEYIMPNEIVIDDGTEKVSIKNKFGEELGIFYFNPTDFGMVQRYNEIADKFYTVTEPLENVSINENGEAFDDAGIKALEESEKRLYELCDYMMGGNVSTSFFAKRNPFTPNNGKFYCEVVLDGISKYIGMRFEAETKKINSRMEKYVHGIRTGKHKDGRK